MVHVISYLTESRIYLQIIFFSIYITSFAIPASILLSINPPIYSYKKADFMGLVTSINSIGNLCGKGNPNTKKKSILRMMFNKSGEDQEEVEKWVNRVDKGRL